MTWMQTDVCQVTSCPSTCHFEDLCPHSFPANSKLSISFWSHVFCKTKKGKSVKTQLFMTSVCSIY